MKTLAMDWKMSETFTAVRINVPNEITLLIIPLQALNVASLISL